MIPRSQNGSSKTSSSYFQSLSQYWISDKLAKVGSSAYNVIKQKSVEQQDKLNKRINQVPFMKNKDKFSFVLGIFMMMGTEYLMLENPQWFPGFYTALLFPLLFYRFFDYHKSNYHYFMLDFCYYMQVFTLLLIWAFPHDPAFFKLFFGLSNGPLLFAIIMWKNRVVFHDLDKLTSLFIHFMPPLVSYVFRWCLKMDENWLFHRHSIKHELTKADFAYMVFFYALWQFLYWIKVEVVDQEKLNKDKTIVTSARWLSEYQPHPLYVAIKARFPFVTPQATLIATQLMYTGFTLLLIPITYNSQLAHFIQLVVVFAFACWYGAQFYFDTFAENYMKRLEKTVAKFNQPQETEQEKSEHFQRKYCPNSLRSFVIFNLYFLGAFLSMMAAFYLTIWS